MAEAKKSRLNAGEYEITLDGKAHTLKPSLAAFNRLAALGPYTDVAQRILSRDAGTLAVVIRHGLGWDDTKSRNLADLMYKTGTHALCEPLYRYFFALFHAGKTVEQVNAEVEAKNAASSDGEGDEGNALTGA